VIQAIIAKLPMRDKAITRTFYLTQLGFQDIGIADFDDYLILEKDGLELHFFAHPDLDPNTNDGQIYIRTIAIEQLYQSILANNGAIHPNGHLKLQPWGQIEFSMLDPDKNLLNFGQNI
jgi:hypothetical protein